MKLYDVVFTDKQSAQLNVVEVSTDVNSKYKSIFVENDITKQRYFLSKNIIRDLIKDRKEKSHALGTDFMKPIESKCLTGLDTRINMIESDQTDASSHPEASCTVYNLDNIIAAQDIRNNNIVFDNRTDDNDNNQNIVSISIDNSVYQLVDYEGGSRIVQTGRRNGFQTCIISVDNTIDESYAFIYIMSIILRSVHNPTQMIKYNIIINNSLTDATPDALYILRYNLNFSDTFRYLEYNELISSSGDKFYKNFKLSEIYGLFSEVVLVNTKYVKQDENGNVNIPIINDNISGREYVKEIIPCTDKMINDEGIDETLKNAMLNKNVRVITTVGLKLSKDFCKKYKILYVYAYNPKTDISTCVKTN